MKNNRLRLSLAIFFTILYMVSALTWWTFALIKLQTNDFEKETKIHKLKMDLVENKLLLRIFSHPASSSINYTIKIGNQLVKSDTNQINQILKENFSDYFAEYKISGQHNALKVCLHTKDDIHLKLLKHLSKKKRAWVMEGITMGFITLIIGIAMFIYLDRVIRLNQQQNNFMLAVTHELKTPIAAAKLALQTATKKSDPAFLEKMYGMAQSNLVRLSKMVEQILLATRFESKFLTLQTNWVSLSNFVLETLDEMELNPADRQNIQVNIPQNLKLNLDDSMFNIVITNLVNNAIKYSEHDPHIVISAECILGQGLLKIADTGVGIPDTEKKKVFKRFYRIGDEQTRSTSGSGLGLFLVHRICQFHKAKIFIENNTPKGSIFIIKFLEKDSILE